MKRKFFFHQFVVIITTVALVAGFSCSLPPKVENVPKARASTAQGLYAEGIEVTASSTSWVDVATIAAVSFTAGKTYLIYANAIISNNNSTSEAQIRLVYGATPTVFTDASAAYELTIVAAGTGNRTNYSYMTVLTQPEPTVLVKLQISNSSTNTTTAELGQIFTLKLSDDFVQNTDWCYTEVTTDYTTEANFSNTSSTDAASCSLLTNGSDDYLAIASAIVDITTTNSSYRMSLYESVLNVDEPAIDIEGEDTINEFRGHTLTRTYAAPSAVSHLWQPRFNHEATTAYTILSSRIFVINLAKFNQHSYSYATAEEAPAATPSWTTTRTLAPTPTVTGDWFIFGSFGNDVNVLLNDTFARLQINPAGGGLASDPAYGDDAPHEDSWNLADVTGFNIFKMVSLSSGAPRTINLDVQSNSGTLQRVQERHLVAFSLELYVPPSYTPKSTDWRWYDAEQTADPANDPNGSDTSAGDALDSENTMPTSTRIVYDGNIIKLRIGVNETGGAAGTDVKFHLEYDTLPLFLAATNVGEIGSGIIWRYADGVDTDNGDILTKRISTTANNGTHNESGTSASTFDPAASTSTEFEFTIQNNGAIANTRYYFRLYYTENSGGAGTPNGAVALTIGNGYPNVTTAGAYDLELSTAPASVSYGSINAGDNDASYIFTADEKIGFWDKRSTGTYTLSVSGTNMTNGGNTILNSDITWKSPGPDSVDDILNVAFTSSKTGMVGQNGATLAVPRSAYVADPASEGKGGFYFSPTIDLTSLWNKPAGNYTGTITLTIA